MKVKQITMILEKSDTGFSAYTDCLPIFTTADSMPQLLNNAHEAIDLFYEDKPLLQYEVVFQINFVQFFKYYRVLNAKFLAQKIGMNPTLLSQYVSGHKQASQKQQKRILDGIREVGRELSELEICVE